jgi:hypothetical protein
MITIRTTTDVTTDRQIVVTLPPETPIGKAEIVVTVAPQGGEPVKNGDLRRRFGTVHSGDANGADNERIDAISPPLN